MAKKSFGGGFDSMLGGSKKTSEPTPKEPAAAPQKEVKKAVAPGPKGRAYDQTKDGEKRCTYIVRESIDTKLKALSKIEGMNVKDVIGEAFERFINSYEKKHGEIDLSILKKKKIM